MKSTWFNYLKIGEKPGKIPELDGIRALAILLVVFHHFATYYQEYHHSFFKNAIPEIWQQAMFNGWLGVDLFFVLSGYLIFHHLSTGYAKPNHRLAFGRYGLKRVLRTFPLYFAMIGLIVFGLIPYYKTVYSYSDLLVHMVFLQDYLGAHLLTPMWSLATEEKFYLLAPLLLFLLRWPLSRSVALLLVIVVFITLLKSLMMHQTDVSLNAISYFELFRAPFHYAITSILIGVLVAIISQGSTVKAQPTLFWVSALGAFGILCWANLYQAENWHLLNGLHLLMVLMFGLMIWTAVQFSGAPWLKWLTGRTLRTISVLSYAWYLAHYTVLPWVYRLHRGYIRSEEPWIHTLSFLAIYVGISLLFSLLLHYLIEKPFLLWKDRV
ncbi:MAG: acyltransferase [Marinicella sp.]